MRAKPLWFASLLASISLALLLGTARIHAQDATPEATAAVQFDLSQRYQDSLYSVSYPDGWMTQTAPGAVSLMSDPQVLSLTQRFGIPPLAHGQIAIQIMSGVLGAVIPNSPAQITNVNCTSCHVLVPPASASLNGVETAPSPNDITDAVALVYSGAPFYFPFERAQTIKLGSFDAAEATFASHKDDGLLIEFYLNGQLVNVLALVASGEQAETQPLIEAIVSTIQTGDAAPDATSTESP